MTTFVVSLFLPYTIEFDLTTSGNRSPISPPTLIRGHSTNNVGQLSLLPVLTAPPTPNYTADVDPFFPGHASSKSTSHTANTSVPQPEVPIQPSVPEWGRGRIFNQPLSKPSPAPPSTVLRYAKAQEAHAATQLHKLGQITTPRHLSRERRFSESGWNVRNAVQGDGGLANAIKAAEKGNNHNHRLWVGTVGFPTDTLNEAKKYDIAEKLESEYDALTVFVNDSDFDGHYTNYCKTILWPFLHYQIPDHPKSKAYEDHSWIYYVKVNEAFADRVVRDYKHGDTIWVHDYHLLLVPAMIRKKLPDARIGFFLHTAFPSSEVFRCLAVRKQLLEGMLGANLIAFQAVEYANHFLTTCGRLLVVEATEHGVQLENHFVDVTSVPIGIVPEHVKLARQEPEVDKWIKALELKYKDKRIIVAKDKLDPTSGVRQKLLSYEMFLNNNPEWRDKVVLLQIATPRGGESKELDSAIADIVTRIDAKYSTLSHQPLVFLRRDIAYSQHIALMTAADVLMVTPLRDGMNLTGHEYVICQDGKGGFGKKNGPLILSESTGSATVFCGAELSVNPWDYLQVARAIKRALEMPEMERLKRYNRLSAAVYKNNGEHWVHELNERLSRAYDDHQLRDTMSVPRLSIKTLGEQYMTASTRLFILDYEGTLATKKSRSGRPSVLADPQRVVDTIIALLAASDANVVYISSGRSPSELEYDFRKVPGVGLIAENGCYVRPFTPEFTSQSWIDLAESCKASEWKKGVMAILQYYVERIEGSWVEERDHGLQFHYEGVKGVSDIESAARQAGDCANHINDSCQELRIRAVPCEKSVIVESMDHSKMTAAVYVMGLERRRLGGPELSTLDNPSTPADSRRPSLRSPFTLPIGSPKSSNLHFNGDDRRKRRQEPTLTPPDSAVNGVSYFSPHHDHHTKGHSEPPPTPVPATVPDFLMVAGDNREDEPVFRWAEGLGRERVVRMVVSVCVGQRSATEAGCTLTQGVAGLLTALGKLATL